MDLTFSGTDGDGDKCSSLRRALVCCFMFEYLI